MLVPRLLLEALKICDPDYDYHGGKILLHKKGFGTECANIYV